MNPDGRSICHSSEKRVTATQKRVLDEAAAAAFLQRIFDKCPVRAAGAQLSAYTARKMCCVHLNISSTLQSHAPFLSDLQPRLDLINTRLQVYFPHL